MLRNCIKYLLSVLFILLCLTIVSQALTIGAFNVQVFGGTKIAKPDVASILVQIFRRYDLALIQEIRDTTQTAVFQLLDMINDYSGPKYSLILSDRLGRTTSKEQYGFFYKESEFTHLAAFQYNDTLNRFERPPFPNLWKINANGFEFFTVPIHTSPDYAVSEIDALADVFDKSVEFFSEPNGIVMGDFNAGCNYVSKSAWSTIRLRNESRFVWLIPDDSDTTATTTVCPYDRFVVSQGPMKDLVYNTTIFTFDTYFNLNYTQATAVSDHYSIELNLNVQQNGPVSSPTVSFATRDFVTLYVVGFYFIVSLVLF
eukprot:TRINITY_DN2852_c0_g1_i1.p1 TRINITY_DN2852_c0_g1~~TRINITY_DN2852_c0_g1_i1.p1  ORF type:complete len:314 (+),score=36.59 TRINITY_DN2852_c0_g1_i1:127-1068(+)